VRAQAPRAPPSEAGHAQSSQVSSHAVGTGELALVRYLDLVLLGLALPVILAAGLPVLGWAAVAVAWPAQRAIAVVLERRAEASREPRTIAGLMTASMIGRAWVIALTIFGAGLIEREAGLTAAVLSLALFSVYFGMRMATR
jgi:hypothetical protein